MSFPVSCYDGLPKKVTAKAKALGIDSAELMASYANVSASTMRRMLEARPGTLEKLYRFNKTLDGLEILAKSVYPIPLDFRRVNDVQKLQARMEQGLTVVSNADGEPVAPNIVEVLAGKNQEEDGKLSESYKSEALRLNERLYELNDKPDEEFSEKDQIEFYELLLTRARLNSKILAAVLFEEMDTEGNTVN